MANILDQKPQEEDASVLKFPKGKIKSFKKKFKKFFKEFENAETLLISEVHMLMENR